MSVRVLGRPLAGVVACTAVLVVAAGCGLTEEQPRPGIAVEVAGQTLDLRTVDQTVEDYCAGLATVDDAEAYAVGSVRSDIARSWVQAVAVEELADELGVDLPNSDVEEHEVEESWDGFGELTDDNYDSFELLTWIQQQLSEPLELIGAAHIAEQSGTQVQGQPAYDEGVALVTAWVRDHQPEFNPVFGDFDPEEGTFSASDGLSLPVSAEAADEADAAQLTPEQIAALPAAQQCGAPAKAGGAAEVPQT